MKNNGRTIKYTGEQRRGDTLLVLPIETSRETKMTDKAIKDYDGLLRTIELNGAHIDIYKHSVVFNDNVKETCWEYDWKDLYKITEKEDNL